MIAVAVTIGSVLVVATCSTSRDRMAPPATPTAAPLDTAVQAAVTATSESVAPPMPTEVPAAPTATVASTATPAEDPSARGAGHELDRFYAALRGLEKHARKEHVRVAWLGDSHGAADLWSGPLREALQKRFGSGGPGFVHVGYKAARHEQVRAEIKGKWATTPKGPSTVVHTGDGVFGLGGVLLTGASDGPRTTISVTDATLPPALTWDLCYKLESPHDEIQYALAGQPEGLVKLASGEKVGVLRHLVMQSSGASPALKIWPSGGQPRFCGMTIETDAKAHPGVVLDTLGINGARLATQLAWHEAEWVAEASRRTPALVILEYGTNESGDHVIKPETYVENLRRVMARVHTASPECDCLVLAPTDRADTAERTPLVVEALRAAARVSNCMFWDTYAVMGGKGSINTWRTETPPRAAPDGVHLRARGYRELGDRLSADVLAGYRP
ncbi:putative periplasmic protein [Minicystis rosea]|nr:putative periplasmic protein [Minicystis rosea]